MNRRQTAIMMAQFRKATATPSEYIKYSIPDSNQTNIWYLLLSNFSGDENEFTYEKKGKTKYGEYLVKMEAPNDFPYNPPKFTLLTPNGVYDTDGVVCISIGEFHRSNYRATLGMFGFANQLVSGLIGWKSLGGGIRLIKTSKSKKKSFAEASHDFNMKNYPEIMKIIDEQYEEYSKKFK